MQDVDPERRKADVRTRTALSSRPNPLWHAAHGAVRRGYMYDSIWAEVPAGLNAGRWITRHGCKTVLVVVHTLTSLMRLHDFVDLVKHDLRVQVVVTLAPDL